ncbi:MAG TPA: prepilin-type N-terminal cleavage/methylation domain-containing protein [bacterium]|nr:prepilin-type N-terminal cleavage/methylation domain-containing protein [bacterium]HQP99028.1 prepilin-type N-terminal cleavage/methylation domain-containing protein [bacterium]
MSCKKPPLSPPVNGGRKPGSAGEGCGFAPVAGPSPQPSPGGKRRRSGFTLVEAILAMSIMAIAVVGIMGAFSGALMSGSMAEDYTLASMRAQLVMAQVRAGGITPYDVNQGTFSEDTKFQWSVNFTESEAENLYEVEVTIAWIRSGRKREFKVTTYQYSDPYATPVSM